MSAPDIVFHQEITNAGTFYEDVWSWDKVPFLGIPIGATGYYGYWKTEFNVIEEMEFNNLNNL